MIAFIEYIFAFYSTISTKYNHLELSKWTLIYYLAWTHAFFQVLIKIAL
jgi:hypothetical protein